MAISRAAAVTLSRSGSRAPRSIASNSARLISKGMRSSTSGWMRRRRACTSLLPRGEAMGSARPSSTSDAPQPSGPRKSTTRRADSSARNVRLASFSISAQPSGVIGAFSRNRWFMSSPAARHGSQAADAQAPVAVPAVGCGGRLLAAVFDDGLDLGDGRLGEEVSAQMPGELGIAAAQPFQHHGGVLLLLVAIVLEDGPQLGIGRGLGALVVPVDGLQLLHQGDDGAVLVDGVGT